VEKNWLILALQPTKFITKKTEIKLEQTDWHRVTAWEKP
jgi:single-stranded DNA-binding protein